MRALHFILIFSSFFLLAGQCASESEENQYYKNEKLDSYRYEENKPVGKQLAIENWELFLEESQNLLFYTRNNLDALQLKIAKNTGDKKMRQLQQYDIFKNNIDELERNKDKRDTNFNIELNKYNSEVNRKNSIFIKQFKRENERINIDILQNVDILK